MWWRKDSELLLLLAVISVLLWRAEGQAASKSLGKCCCCQVNIDTPHTASSQTTGLFSYSTPALASKLTKVNIWSQLYILAKWTLEKYEEIRVTGLFLQLVSPLQLVTAFPRA